MGRRELITIITVRLVPAMFFIIQAGPSSIGRYLPGEEDALVLGEVGEETYTVKEIGDWEDEM